MAKKCISLLLIFICILAVVDAGDEKSHLNDEKVSNDYWCIARADAPDDKLQELLDYLCGNEDCSPIQPGGPCFDPNTVRDHASFALNLNFRNIAACSLKYGNVTSLDPSYGNCHYRGYTDD